MKPKLTRKPRTARRIAEDAGCCRVTVYRWLRSLPRNFYAIDYVREGASGPFSKAYYSVTSYTPNPLDVDDLAHLASLSC